MLKVIGSEAAEDEVDGRSLLDEITREGARRMLVAALETEVAAYVEAHCDERDAVGHALVVRNGKGRTRKVTRRFRDHSGERAPRERPANRPRRRAPPVHEPHPASLHAPLSERGRGAARALPAGALHRRLPRGPGRPARG
jgi:hypothetical protein